jgi:hypothetical protein
MKYGILLLSRLKAVFVRVHLSPSLDCIDVNFYLFYQVVMTWLPRAEERLQSMTLISANARSVRIQIEEFKVRTTCCLGVCRLRNVTRGVEIIGQFRRSRSVERCAEFDFVQFHRC